MDLRVVDCEYTVEEDGYKHATPIIHLFGRDTAWRRHHVRVRGFAPYFCVRQSAYRELAAQLNSDDRVTAIETTDTRGRPERAIDGDALVRVCVRDPADVADLRELFDDPFEADVQYPVRFLVDMASSQWIQVPDDRHESNEPCSVERVSPVTNPPSVTPPLRVCTYDIEVAQGGDGPPVVSTEGTERAANPITAIAAHDSYTDAYRLWLTEHPMWDDSAHKRLRESCEAAVEIYSNPHDTVAQFCEWVVNRRMDALTGWNACVPSDTPVQMADGNEKNMEDVGVGDEIVGIEDGKPSIGEITAKAETQKQRMDIELESGETIAFSEEHDLLIGDEDGVSWKCVGDIESGDYVLHPHELPVDSPEIPTFADLIPLERQRYYEDDVAEIRSRVEYGGIADVAQELGVAKGTAYNDYPGVWRPDKVDDIADEYDLRPLPEDTFYQCTRRELNQELSKHDLYLVGLVMSDGSMEKEGSTINFYNNRKELHEQFPDENKLYDGKDEYDCLSQKVLSASYAWAFNGLGVPFGKKNGSYDGLDSIYSMPKEYIGAFLAGLIDGDGWVDSTVHISVLDNTAQKWVQKLFMRLGIVCGLSGKDTRVKLSSRSYDSVEQYILPHISHSEKKSKIRSLEPCTEASTEAVPKCLVDFDEIDKSARYAYRNGYNLTRGTCGVDDWGGWYFDRVESVEGSGETVEMYDIETTVESFVADETLVHNSGFDHPYLINYGLTNGVSAVYELSPIGDVYPMDGDGAWVNQSLKGRLLLDSLSLYKKTQIHSLDSYRLADVAEAEAVSVGKLDVESEVGDTDGDSPIDYAWKHEPTTFVEYSIRDVKACVAINRESQRNVDIL